MLQVGGNPVKEDPALIDQVANLDGDYEFTTYMSLSCQNCPTVVQALNTMAVINPRIKHTAVEGSLFGDEVEAITEFDPLTGKKIASLNSVRIYANSHYVTPGPTLKQAMEAIRHELAERLKELEAENTRLKKLLAEQMFENDVIKDALRKKW